MSDNQSFFEELRSCYEERGQMFIWSWELIQEIASSKNLPPGVDMATDYVCFIAFNLAKNILHGKLPPSIHARMMFTSNHWVSRYAEYISK